MTGAAEPKRYPPDETWCWVTRDHITWFPAYRDEGSAGGWSNGDTWEDFERAIIDWQVIEPPKAGAA